VILHPWLWFAASCVTFTVIGYCAAAWFIDRHRPVFGFGIVDADGAPYWGTGAQSEPYGCVSDFRDDLEETIARLNTNAAGPRYRIVRLRWEEL